jgi:phenylpyruvate tautomerase PptA (4-oxalocrotonate tautomerase family)
VQKPKDAAFKRAALDAVHAALVASGVPEADRFHRVIELEAEDFRYDASYPDLESARDANFVVVEILLSVGRSVKVKRKILADIVAGMGRAPGIKPDDVFVVFKETQWENWAFGGGRMLHA